jgi:hypothetical protein
VAARSAFLALRAATRLRRSGDATELPAALVDSIAALQREDLLALSGER